MQKLTHTTFYAWLKGKNKEKFIKCKVKNTKNENNFQKKERVLCWIIM